MKRLASVSLVSLLAATLLLLSTSLSQAEPGDPAAILGQTRDAGALPFWTKPNADDIRTLGERAQAMERGIFVIGYSKNHGTGWVISKKHRLLVTNAHVADIMVEAGGKMFAIPSGTSQVYRVQRIWYHPGVRRIFQGDSIRSMDP